MKRPLAFVLVMLVGAIPAAAQQQQTAGGDSGGHARSGGGASSGAAAPRGGSSGGGSSSGGGQTSSGGSGGGTVSSGGSGAGHVTAGGRHEATGGSGVAVPRGQYTSGRREGGGTNARTPDEAPSGAPPHARARGDEPITGVAVPRGSVPSTGHGGGTVIVSGSPYPWWFGGVGYYGGYYGGYYDPWFGGSYGPYDPQPSITHFSDEGTLRLKIKPREAEVYVDGYYVGIVDDFDGIFQKLHLESGPHRIEVRAAGYEPLVIDVRIDPEHGTTYQGELKKLP